VAYLNWPNRISAARVVLVVPFIICLLNLNTGWAGWRYGAVLLFAAMAASDALDGFLARRLHQETQLGRYLDPLGDKLLIASAVILLAIEATAVENFKLPTWVAVIAIGKDVLMMIGFSLIYMTTHRFLVEPRALGKLCTAVQLAMILYALVGPDLPSALQGLLPPAYWLASALAVVAAADYVRAGSRFATAASNDT
jgi:CDP-diacylglycerol--glycerol-3-phosphate 3-phosphatidyltransferase